MINFNSETFRSCQEEIAPMVLAQGDEMGHYKGERQINMDWDLYNFLSEAGRLYCFTARKEGILIGYGLYMVGPHPHYKEVKFASEDLLYIKKEERGFGKDFIKWMDEEMKKDGVTTVTQYVKPWYDFSSMLLRLGYEKAETVYSRRLN